MTIAVRALAEADLDSADRVFRLAFGTFVGMPDPLQFGGDTDFVRTRYRAAPGAAFAAESDGTLVASNFAARWGSFAFFGPLSVHPELWDKGIGKKLVEPVVDLFDRWGVTHRGLFTFAHSMKHHALYQKFGFYPRFLTAVLERPATGLTGARPSGSYAETAEDRRPEFLSRCRELAGGILPGLDLASEIDSVDRQRLGDTIVIGADASQIEGFAVLHAGPGSEAGSGVGYVKFGAVRSGPEAERSLRRLVDACGYAARARGATTLLAGVNLARERTYRSLLGIGFRTVIVGVAMQAGPDAGFNRPDAFVLDDWR